MNGNSAPDRDLADAVKQAARESGFDLVGIAPATSPQTLEYLENWLNQGYAGEMGYLLRRREAYRDPNSVLPGVRSVVVVAMNYRTVDPPVETAPHAGRVSRYAWGAADYHGVLREGLRRLGDRLHVLAPGCRSRPVVDTAPLLERDFARLAGLGWFGKNTMLLNRRQGSWLFLGALLTDVLLAADAPHETAHCGTCTRCLDACPTGAFVGPYVLDARRCISYLTIELRDQPIPADLRPGVGAWALGCDVCQDVCPWNHKAPRSSEPAFEPRPDLAPADCVALLGLSEEEFRARFGTTPLMRPGRAAVLRNACVVLGNRAGMDAVPALTAAMDDPAPLVRGAAAWALSRIGGAASRRALESRRPVEHNPDVCRELDDALRALSSSDHRTDV
jgi:epoxyqueuosine reductase